VEKKLEKVVLKKDLKDDLQILLELAEESENHEKNPLNLNNLD